MEYSETSLPPRVEGPPRGYLTIDLSLKLNQRPSDLRHPAFKLAWWGCNEHDADVIPLDLGAGSITYILNSSPEHITQYLRDVGVLDVQLFDTEKGPSAVVGILKLDSHKAANEATGCICPVACPQRGDEIGSVHVDITLTYGPQNTISGTTAASLFQQLPASQELDTETLEDSVDDQMVPQCLPHSEEGLLPDQPCPATVTAAAGLETELAALKLLETPTPVDACSPLPSSDVVEEASSYHEAADIDNGSPKEEEQKEICPSPTEHSTASLCIRIDSAFQLPQYLAPRGSSSHDCCMVYATAVWQRSKEHRSSTHTTSVHDVPPVGLTAVWNAQLELEMDTNALVDAAHLKKRDGKAGLMEGPLLLFNVWRSGGPLPNAEELLAAACRGDNRQPAVPTSFDELIGCAVVDVCSLLQESRTTSTQMSGKFPLISSQHETQGLIHASIVPNDVLAAALALIVPSAGVNHTRDTSHAPRDQLEKDTASIEIVEHSQKGLERGGGNTNATKSQHPIPAFSSQAEQKKKVQYAWSGSDSDDDLGAVGVGMYMDGAVSCSDHEDYEEDIGDTGRVPQLITQDDWLFDISRPVVNTAAVAQPPPPIEHAVEPQIEKKKPIISFKNKLLPALVEYQGAPLLGPESVAQLPATEQSVATADVVWETRLGPAPESVERIFSVNATASLSQTGVSRSRSGALVHGSGQSEDWLFGIGRPASTEDTTRRNDAPVPRSPSVNGMVATQLACSQFEAMSSTHTVEVLENDEKKRPGSSGDRSSSIARKAQPGSPTLTEVLHSLSSMRNNS